MATGSAPSPHLGRLHPGDTFTTSGRTIAEADLVAFATQTGDLHPLHVDAEWAASSVFGERVAPGMLTLSYALGLLRLDPERAIALSGISDAVFARPVKIGDTISVRGRVASVAPGDAGTSVVGIALSVVNQHGKTVCRLRLQVKWKDPGVER